MSHRLSKRKAKEMLRHGTVHGKPLSGPQRRYFGLLAGGGKATRLEGPKRKKRRGSYS